MSIFDNIGKAAQELGKEASKALSNKTETFTFSALPESVAELQALPEASMDTPYKTAALTVAALCAFAAAPEVGLEMLNYLKGPQPFSQQQVMFMKERIRDCGVKCPFSYFAGATPDNNYTPAQPFKVSVTSNPYSFTNEGYATIWIKSGGADSPREVQLRRKGTDGPWYLWEQFLLVQIRPAKEDDPWA